MIEMSNILGPLIRVWYHRGYRPTTRQYSTIPIYPWFLHMTLLLHWLVISIPSISLFVRYYLPFFNTSLIRIQLPTQDNPPSLLYFYPYSYLLLPLLVSLTFSCKAIKIFQPWLSTGLPTCMEVCIPVLLFRS